MPVQVVFEQHDDIYFPLFEPANAVPMTDFENRSIISGIGQSAHRAQARPQRPRPHARRGARRHRRRRPDGRRHRRPRRLPRRDDGRARAASPVRAHPTCRTRCASSSTGTAAAAKAPRRSRPSSTRSWPSAPDLARHVLVYRTVTESTAQGEGGRAGIGLPGSGMGGGGGGAPKMGGEFQWLIPMRAYSAACWLAMCAQRHMHEFGTTHEQLAQIALNARRHAGRNPNAIFREPMTLDDYMSSRMITTPFHLYDCDVPCDGSTAVIVSAADHAPERRPSRRPRRSDGHRAARSPVVGSVGRHDHDVRPRRRRADVDAHRRSSRPTSTSPSSTTASRSSP